eukprot:11194481-Lingulodinium_polyedra.AAC.1
MGVRFAPVRGWPSRAAASAAGFGARARARARGRSTGSGPRSFSVAWRSRAILLARRGGPRAPAV